MRRTRRALLTLSSTFLLVTLATSSESRSEPPEGLLHDVRIADQHGEEQNLGVLAQERLVLDFAASWCDPCYETLPRLQTLAREHPQIHFVVVSVDETEAGWDRLIQDLGLELPVVWDRGQELVESFAPEGFPATYVFEDGRLILRQIGTGSRQWRQLTEALDRLGEEI